MRPDFDEQTGATGPVGATAFEILRISLREIGCRLLSILLVACLVPAGAAVAACVDEDGDGFGVHGDPSCPGGTTPDCDDTDATVYPGAPQTCDGLNNDCEYNWPLLIDWDDREIGSPPGWGWRVIASDVDTDGDLDAVFGTYSYNSGSAFGWYENVAGDGSAWSEHTISDEGFGVLGWDQLSVLDLDEDGDPDLLSTPDVQSSEVLWFENATGNGSAWIEREIGHLQWSSSVAGGDLDGDGDPDVVAGAYYESEYQIVGYRNQGGSPLHWSGFVVATDLLYINGLFVADMDGDLDQDILVSHRRLSWYENVDGSGSAWIRHEFDGPRGSGNVLAADIDNDGDPDVLAANENTDGLFWYENSDSCCTKRPIWSTVGDVKWVSAADLDSDGDIDVLAISRWGVRGVYWYENVAGDGSVWRQHLLSLWDWTAVTGDDLTADGALDVLAITVGSIHLFQQAEMENHDADGDGLTECEGDCDDSHSACIDDCSDGDGDGVCQAGDNCPDRYNPGQEDSDENGVGDACEGADVPAITETGAVLLALLLLLAGPIIVFRRGSRSSWAIRSCSTPGCEHHHGVTEPQPRSSPHQR